MGFAQTWDGFGNISLQNVRTGKKLLTAYDNGGLSNGAQDYVVFFDDFLGDALDARWSGGAGSDAQAVAPAANAQIGGAVRLTSGNTGSGDDTGAIDGSSLTHGLQWEADNGGLRMEAKVKFVTTVATAYAFVGFTDTLATTTVEYPFKMNGTTLTDTATNACGFLYDSTATNDVWILVGTKAGAGTYSNNSASIAPTADTWVTLAIEVDTAGSMTGFINGANVGTLADAITVTTDVTPAIVAGTNTTAVQSLDVDYVEVMMQR